MRVERKDILLFDTLHNANPAEMLGPLPIL
jgi:hypothetical protein